MNFKGYQSRYKSNSNTCKITKWITTKE